MRKYFVAFATGLLVLALSIGAGISAAAGTASGGKGKADQAGSFVHDLKGPKTDEQRALREKALKLLLEYERAQEARLDTQSKRWDDLFRFMVQRGLVQDTDIDDFRERVMTLIQTPPAPVKTGVGNFFSNLFYPTVIVNDLGRHLLAWAFIKAAGRLRLLSPPPGSRAHLP